MSSSGIARPLAVIPARSSRPASAACSSARPTPRPSAPSSRCSSGPGSTRNMSAACSSSVVRSEEHTSELQSPCNIVCRLLLEKKKNQPPPSEFHQRVFESRHRPQLLPNYSDAPPEPCPIYRVLLP